MATSVERKKAHMAKLVLVHGRNQQFETPDKEERDWIEALRWGLKRVDSNFTSDFSASLAFYGDLWLQDANERSASRVANIVELSLEKEILEEAGVKPPAPSVDELGGERSAGVNELGEERLGWNNLVDVVGFLEQHLPGDISRQFLKSFVADVSEYLNDETLRAKAIQRVVDKIKAANDEVILLAHSLGTVVAYDTLIRNPNLPVKGYISVASPLGFTTVRQRVSQPGISAFPSQLSQWVNVYNREDFVASIRELVPLYPATDNRKILDKDMGEGRSPSLLNPFAAHDPLVYFHSKALASSLDGMLKEFSSVPVLETVGVGAEEDYSGLESLNPDDSSWGAWGGGDSDSSGYGDSDSSGRGHSGGRSHHTPPRYHATPPDTSDISGAERSAGDSAKDVQIPVDGNVPETPKEQETNQVVNRNLSADFPHVVQPGSENLLNYAISKQALLPYSAPFKIEVAPEVTQLPLTISVQANDFTVMDAEGSKTINFDRVTLDLTKPDQEIQGAFTLKATESAAQVNTVVVLRVSYKGLPVGQVSIPTTITSDSHGKSGRKKQVQPTGTLSISFKAAPAPDLILHVNKVEQGKYKMAVDSNVPGDQFNGQSLGDFTVGESAWKYSRSILEQFRAARELNQDERTERINGIGITLWRDLPTLFQNFYWEKMHGKELSIAIYSDEPYIPWELIKPESKTGGADVPMLGVSFAIARWKQATVFPNPLTVSGFGVVAPRYTSNPLPYAQAEADALHTTFGAQQTPAQRTPLLDLLRSNQTQLVHFCGHGSFNPEVADESQILLETGALSPFDIAGLSVVSTKRALIFVNACEVGQQGWALTNIGGWADTFVSSSFSGFIGPYWAVNDLVAKKAALIFYEQLRQGKTVAEAVREIRKHFYTDDDPKMLYHPTWLSYSLHCQPNVNVVFHTQDKN